MNSKLVKRQTQLFVASANVRAFVGELKKNVSDARLQQLRKNAPRVSSRRRSALGASGIEECTIYLGARLLEWLETLPCDVEEVHSPPDVAFSTGGNPKYPEIGRGGLISLDNLRRWNRGCTVPSFRDDIIFGIREMRPWIRRISPVMVRGADEMLQGDISNLVANVMMDPETQFPFPTGDDVTRMYLLEDDAYAKARERYRAAKQSGKRQEQS